jgi:chromosome segregation ATPase
MPVTKTPRKKAAAHGADADLLAKLQAAEKALDEERGHSRNFKLELDAAHARISQLEQHLHFSHQMRDRLLAHLQEARTLLTFLLLHWQATPLGKALLRAQGFLNGTKPQPGEERPQAAPLDAPDGRTM